jgi:hypothetical protein
LVLGGLAVIVAILQIGGLVSAGRRGRSYSFVPFVGALLGIAACLVGPWRYSAYAIPIFLVLDPTLVIFAFWAIKGRPLK